MFIIGIYLIKDKFKKQNKIQVRFKRNRYKELSEYIKNQLEYKDTDISFKKIGLNITTLQYQTIRYLVTISIFILFLIIKIKNGTISVKYYITIVILFTVTSPQIKFLGKKTPFAYIIEILHNEHKRKKDMELYRALTQLKNLAIAQQHKPIGADFIIQQLMKFTKITKPTFAKMLSIWRLGQEEKACKFFAEEIGTKLSIELSNIFLKLDKINPYELTEQLTLYQTNVREERRTAKLKNNELISNLLFIPIVASALIILLNFVVIVVYIDQMNNISNILK